ncbi:MAG: hypothetical protein JNK63_01755 [Chthonomonas sp.]|nr:hypothetical protein [Chthonomonas sp.]
MIQTLLAFVAMASGQTTDLRCPVMGSPVNANSPSLEYAGSKFSFCCAGCDANFTKTPEVFLAKRREAKQTVGTFLFDPVSRQRLNIDKAVATADFDSIRYPFISEANKQAFLASPAKYATVPPKESLYCPIGKEEIPTHSMASDYMDHNGVRWFMCCSNCVGVFERGPKDSLVAGLESHVHPIKVVAQAHDHGHQAEPETKSTTKVKFGKYEAVLRIPEGGLYAQKEIDVEFRVTDTTAKDPVEEGFKGVGGIEATAIVTMPSMHGMPPAKPKVHREGVPGDYGIELFFPHGGEYKIDLTLKMPGQAPQKVAFVVDVKDEKPATTPAAQPYTLKVVDWPKQALAGRAIPLKMRVVDSKSGATQKSFDLAHEKRFHLLIASKDLNWFIHEHPVMAKDGTWSIPIKFPAGGDYWVYGDVAPAGKGSRVLIAKVAVQGPKPTWNTKLIPSTQATSGGLQGTLKTHGIEIGKMATLTVELKDAKTGKPAGDTVKWLGAAGHMMIFHQDGKTVVHSHPNETAASTAQVKQGKVSFTGRFPKPGLYKVYAQFSWRGAIRTLGFALEVK